MGLAYDVARLSLLKRIAQRCRDQACPKCSQPGPRCHHCGKRAPKWLAMEVDHLDGKSWIANKVNSWQRLRIMAREFDGDEKKGVPPGRLVTSCGHCNHSRNGKKYKWNVRARRNRGGRGYSSQAAQFAKYLAHVEREDEREHERQFTRVEEALAAQLCGALGGTVDPSGGQALSLHAPLAGA